MLRPRQRQGKPETNTRVGLGLDAGMGVSTRLQDLVTWEDIDNDFQDSYWHLALEDIDQRLNPQLLIQLLRQDQAYAKRVQADYLRGDFYTDALTPRVRFHLANLWKRYRIKPDVRENELSPEFCRKLARSVEAHEFGRRRGRQRTPSYRMSKIDAENFVATQIAKVLIHELPKEHRWKMADAVEAAARKRGLDPDTFALSYSGKQGGSRRSRAIRMGAKLPKK